MQSSDQYGYFRNGAFNIETRTTNLRERYLPGHRVSFDWVRVHSRTYYSSMPILTVCREALARVGGFHPALCFDQMLGVMPFGVHGFDETAHAFNRQHYGYQTSDWMSDNGFSASGNVADLLRDWDIEARWCVFGDDVAAQLISNMKSSMETSALRLVNIYMEKGKYDIALKHCYDGLKLVSNSPRIRNAIVEIVKQRKLVRIENDTV